MYIFDVESSRVVAFVDGHDNDVNAVRPLHVPFAARVLVCPRAPTLHVTHPSECSHYPRTHHWDPPTTTMSAH